MKMKVIGAILLAHLSSVVYAGPGVLNKISTASYEAQPAVMGTSINTTVTAPDAVTSGKVYIDHRPPLHESDYLGTAWRSRSNIAISVGGSFIDLDGDSNVTFLDQEIIIRPPELDLYLREDLSVISNVDRIKRTARAFSDMTFGYFNNDNKVDLIAYDNGVLEIAYAENNNVYGDWQVYGNSPVPMNELAFGDFDGDGLTDIFRADADRKEWYVSYGRGDGSMKEWQVIKYNTEIGIEDLIFGSFTTPGKTDIAIMPYSILLNHHWYGGGFRRHTGPAGNEWELLVDVFVYSDEYGHMSRVRCADLNNNGLTDVYYEKYLWDGTYTGIETIMDGSILDSSISNTLDLYNSEVLQHRVKNGDWDCDGRIDSFLLNYPIIQ